MEKTKTEEWRKHHRNQINHKPILETDPNNTKQIRPIIQSTRCKATISSLLLSTFSNETTSQQPTNNKKINFSSAAATIRGLGCTASASHQVSVPAVIRASADWPHQGNKTRKKKNKNKRNNKNISSSNDVSSSSATCVDFQDVWCGPGIGFSTDAAASVDCVVSKKNSSSTSRAKIDLDKITHRGVIILFFFVSFFVLLNVLLFFYEHWLFCIYNVFLCFTKLIFCMHLDLECSSMNDSSDHCCLLL
jgi:hypothetical protein